ncbi:hypothetical protein EV126DRAFT_48557 [Verticillium dahliae]|nr:hypothetical protein EV126DRAFT_48557 [Verticillium dahliae]
MYLRRAVFGACAHWRVCGATAIWADTLQFCGRYPYKPSDLVQWNYRAFALWLQTWGEEGECGRDETSRPNGEKCLPAGMAMAAVGSPWRDIHVGFGRRWRPNI